MEYWQDLYHELEEQKEKGLREGKKEGIIDGAQNALILSIFCFFVLWLMISIFLNKKVETAEGHELIGLIYHIILIGIGFFLLIRALINDVTLIGNLSLEEARKEGTQKAYFKNWYLQKNRYHSIGFALVILLNSIIYWFVAYFRILKDAATLLESEATAAIAMILLNIAFVIGTGILKDR